MFTAWNFRQYNGEWTAFEFEHPNWSAFSWFLSDFQICFQFFVKAVKKLSDSKQSKMSYDVMMCKLQTGNDYLKLYCIYVFLAVANNFFPEFVQKADVFHWLLYESRDYIP